MNSTHLLFVCLKENSFQRDGIRRQYIFKDGVFEDVYVYSLLQEDWGKLGKSVSIDT